MMPTTPITAIRMAPPDRKTLQTLGEHSYAIPDVLATSHTSTPALKLLLAPLKALAVIIILPLYTLFMVVAPSALKNKWLSSIIPKLMYSLEQKTFNQRKLLLQQVSGKVLDVGAGGGAYIQHCTKASYYVALEPLEELHPILKSKAHDAGFQDYQVSIRSDTLETYDELALGNGTFDWILLSNVLCSVQNLENALAKVHCLLKPGGHVYFCEHIAAPRGTTTKCIQDLINPWWTLISGGCHCNRESLHAIEGMESWDVVSWTISGIKIGGVPIIMGLARKVDSGV